MIAVKVVFLCHLWFGTHTQLYLAFNESECYGNPKAQQTWVEKYNLRDNWERNRLSAICGWSEKRCPLIRS